MRNQLSWGTAGPWYGEFLRWDKDRIRAMVKFLNHYDLTEISFSIEEIDDMSEENKDWLGNFIQKNNIKITPRIAFDYLKVSDDEAKVKTEKIANQLSEYRPLLNGNIVATGATIGHRFDRLMPLELKLERLSEVLSPLAKICADFGTPLGIENHGDYYCSDLVQLCQTTPHLYIFLDTGNTFLIGEEPMAAFEIAAPFTIGTHFKDHRVRPCPDARPLHFEVAPSVLGEGDVPLRECYELLLRKAPFPDKLVMQIELISPDNMNPIDAFEKSLEYINRLEGKDL